MEESFNYGGQALIEGVMMRGSRVMAVALRHPEGHITVEIEPLNKALYQGRLSRIPFLRGLVSLWDALGLGTKALMMSADVAAGEEASLSGPIGWGAVGFGLLMGIGLFVAFPSFLVGLFNAVIPSEWMSSVLEGGVRLILITGYIWAVGLMPDMRRVFAYHGAEHKTINAYEAGADLTVEDVRPFSTAHNRCGTAFLLTLTLVTILIFAPFGQPSLVWRLVTRLALLPVITGISYEFIRFSARFSEHPIMRALAAPNRALQKLTTREPDEGMLEVAIAALKAVLTQEEPEVGAGEVKPAQIVEQKVKSEVA